MQWVLFLATNGSAILLLTIAPGQVADAARLVFAAAFLTVAAWRVLLALVSAPPADDPSPLPDAELPSYTVVCPLYREAAMVPQLVAALEAIDYPRDRLQALLVLEADDELTRVAAATLVLPPFVSVVVAPLGLPRTKPRACNIALEHATGELLVIFDAEDRPHPGQLREAAARFAVARPEVACFQAPLRIDPVETFFHRQFALE